MKRTKYIGIGALVAVAYIAAGKLGLLFAFTQANTTAVWAPTGIAIAVLLIFGYRLWPAIFIGAFLTNITTAGTPAIIAACIAAGNTLEALTAVYFVNKYANGTKVFDRTQDVLKYAFFAGIISTTISATIGVMALSVGGLSSWASYFPVWITWWLGDAGGALLVAPFLMLWFFDRRITWNPQKTIEATLLFASIFLFGWFVIVAKYEFLFIFMTPILIWIAFRFDRRMMATVILFMTEVYVGELLATTPIVGTGSLNTSLVLVQAFMATTFVTMMALATSVTERKLAEENIRHQALHDSLTGVPNRNYLETKLLGELQRVRREDERMAVLFLDIDHFKHMNDVFGHYIGDLLLKEFAERLNSCIEADDMIARLGGDEFIIVLAHIKDTSDIVRTVKKITKSLESPVVVESRSLFLSVSIGIARFPHDGREMWSLLANADAALLRAKKAGRNHYEFYRTIMNKEFSSQLAVVQELRQALLTQQIEPYYQPVIDVHTHKILNVESLLRWHHPDRGLILASEFVPIAEDHGIMRMLGQETLKTVFKDQREWKKQGFGPVRIAVNLSPREFHETGFIEKLKRMLLENNISPSWLEFEVVENLAMENIQVAKDRFKSLRKLGITVCIDDFGIGHSSLSYLKDLPIDKLKIDKSFVKHSTINSQDAAIIQTIVTLGHTLNLKVIAEGVESEEQLQLLRSLGCDGAQGYFIGKPMPARELAYWASKFEPIM